jgi:hypothetical protein
MESPPVLPLLVIVDITLFSDMRTWLDVRLVPLLWELELIMVLVLFKELEIRLFILEFRFLVKSFVIDSVEFCSTANTVTNDLKINIIDNVIMIPHKIAFMLIISKGIVLYYFLATISISSD